jgi:DNA-binding transcriptional LysR family regulator
MRHSGDAALEYNLASDHNGAAATMIPPPKLFVYLDTVARAGSIRKAAERMHIASTAINRMVIEVEKEIGTPLFERLPRGVRLTAAGELLMGAIRRNISDLASVGSQIEQLRGLVRGRVSVACSESVADELIPITVAQYQKRRRGVQFHVQTGNTELLLGSLLNYDADLLLAHDPPPSEGLQEHATAMQPICAMVPRGHALFGRNVLSVADLQPYPLAIGDHTFFSRLAIESVARRSKLNLQIAIEANSVRTLRIFAQETNSIFFQFQIGTRSDVKSGQFRAVTLTDKSLPKSRLVLGSRSGRSLPIAALSFIETLKDALKGAK